MTTTTELKKLLFSMILKTPIWLVHLAANQSSVNEHTYICKDSSDCLGLANKSERTRRKN